VLSNLRRFAGPAISFLVATGLQVSGYQSLSSAIVLWGIAAIWGAIALVTWEPFRRTMRSIGRRRLGFPLVIGLLLLLAVGLGVVAIQKNARVSPLAPPVAPGVPPLPTKPHAEAPTRHQSEARIIVPPSVTPEYLMGLFIGHTGVQGKKLLEPYIGKWIKVSGPLSNVRPTSPGILALVSIGNKHVFMHFGDQWRERLSVLRLEDKITALCEIREAELFELSLDKCEPVDS